MLHHLWTSSITNQDSLNQPQICTFVRQWQQVLFKSIHLLWTFVSAEDIRLQWNLCCRISPCRPGTQKHDSPNSTFIRSDPQLLADAADQRMGQASHLCLWNLCHLIRASPGGMLLLQIHYSQGGCQTGSWHRGGRFGHGQSWAGKGSGSGSHQGFAKWWWVMSAVWGGEGIMVGWEYRGSSVHTILIHSLSKGSPAMFARLVRRLTHHTCVASTERCCFNFQRREDDSHYISKYHFEIPPPPRPKKSKSFRETT